MDGVVTVAPNLPWYRQVTGEQWRAFWATFLGWIVDAFDFTILTFILIDIQRSFTVNSASGRRARHGDAAHASGRRRRLRARRPTSGAASCR